MAFTVKEFRKLLESLPDEVQDYQVNICTDFDSGYYRYDTVYQLQIIEREWPLPNTVTIHGDITCHVDLNALIYPVVDADNHPIKE